ncbi:bifunctional glutamate/proline--tRNA ligase isoform X1 [Bacillus rossius redtenbacheri]|uniref:bifunctional glutamate/proline--tRNA ligase isoform X1 n=1 Tax=Bacillus rossius redtenbacheri TaxID=93214 RepID=UPI002FDE7E41
MVVKLVANKSNPPIGGLLVANFIKSTNPVSVEWGKKNCLDIGNNICFDTVPTISRYLARIASSHGLYGSTVLERTEVDHWLTFSVGPLVCAREFTEALLYLDKMLGPVTYLVGNKLTIADFAVWGALYSSQQWSALSGSGKGPDNVARWFDFVRGLEPVADVLASLPEEARAGAGRPARKEEGKFVELPGAEMGEVVVRFPPEASGYLHIGHAKAALLNQYYQEAFKGKLIMRFDDTNPAKEKVDFEKVILEDLEMLQVKPDVFSHTSSHFDTMLGMCEELLRGGKAYVDDTEPEQMKLERDQKTESRNRNNSVDQNMKLWQEMKEGTELGQKCCVRAKIDMSSVNGCMRDPTIYRCKNEPHPRTGTKYKVYPTYDFACPIVDSVEGVTHCLRTTEYHDRDDQFYWFVDQLGLRRPYIWEYSRLNMTNTVLSKRKLAWFVEQGLVDGWDDPRFPTVRGILRRGMTVEGLKQFIVAQGSSRSVVVMEWDKIWAFNKKVIDPVAPRYTALEAEGRGTVPVLVEGVTEEPQQVPRHPKSQEAGTKTVWVGPRVLIDYADAEVLVEGENTTFINWGNLLVKKINRENGKIISVEAKPNLSNKDYKKTTKLTWLAETESAPFVSCVCVFFDHIISKPVLGKDDDFKQFLGTNTRTEVRMLGDPELVNVKKSEIIQLQRRGFFICDNEYRPASVHSGRESPIILFAIPDGHAKEQPTTGAPKKAKELTPKEKVQSAKGKTSEKSPVDEIASHKRSAQEISTLIAQQGDKVRSLKSEKAAKDVIDAEVKALLSLKGEFKALTGEDWKPSSAQAPGGQGVDSLGSKIAQQGDRVRQLKADKADKNVVDAEVKALLALKFEYKELTGAEWKPTTVQPSPEELDKKITDQGDKVRKLKTDKVEKNLIDEEVKVLLGLKAVYKSVTGQDWKPGATVPKKTSRDSGENLADRVSRQADKVRKLKAEKVDKNVIDSEVKILLSLKLEYKSATGEEWKAPAASPVKSAMASSAAVVKDSTALAQQVTEQGNKVRQLKSGGGDKATVDGEVKKLLELKAEYKKVTGTDFPAGGGERPTSKGKAPPAKKAPAQQPEAKELSTDAQKKQTRLGLEATKEGNLPEWYSQVLTKAEMIEYYNVSGCYILRPWAFAVWEAITAFFDAEIKKLGVQNCYFPLFVSKSMLEKEKAHLEDFAPEVAWVTKSGDTELAEPIAVRPTSETVMYPAFAKWIQSHRDLPLKLNQWNNVVRWEFKHPQPFLRTREFLWQEGHTAHAGKDDACQEVTTILELYRQIYTDMMAIPVIKGRKSEKEKFAGADHSLTVEGFISASGRGIQGATSHHLGQNFSKMFEVVYEDPETKEKQYVYQNSWGITTRTIGVMVMVHGDNKGLVLPPRVACIQVVLVPCGITASLAESERKALLSACGELEADLRAAGIKVKGDYRDNYSPGWKFNHWEVKGVPVRVELGPKDLKQQQLVAVRRDTGDKVTLKRAEAVQGLSSLLGSIHDTLLERASRDLSAHTKLTKTWGEFPGLLDDKNIILAPFCGEPACEELIKKESAREEALEPGAPAMGAKTLCIPLDQPAAILPEDKCIHPACSKKPLYYGLFGRSY